MEYTISIVILIMMFLAGFILGHFILPGSSGKPTGSLIVDTSDPEKDRWLIKLDEPTEQAAKRHTVILKVEHRLITEEDAIWPSMR